jgi:hypothetical protein
MQLENKNNNSMDINNGVIISRLRCVDITLIVYESIISHENWLSSTNFDYLIMGLSSGQ